MPSLSVDGLLQLREVLGFSQALGTDLLQADPERAANERSLRSTFHALLLEQRQLHEKAQRTLLLAHKTALERQVGRRSQAPPLLALSTCLGSAFHLLLAAYAVPQGWSRPRLLLPYEPRRFLQAVEHQAVLKELIEAGLLLDAPAKKAGKQAGPKFGPKQALLSSDTHVKLLLGHKAALEVAAHPKHGRFYIDFSCSCRAQHLPVAHTIILQADRAAVEPMFVVAKHCKRALPLALSLQHVLPSMTCGSVHALQEQLARAQSEVNARWAQQEAQLQASYRHKLECLQDEHVSVQAAEQP